MDRKKFFEGLDNSIDLYRDEKKKYQTLVSDITSKTVEILKEYENYFKSKDYQVLSDYSELAFTFKVIGKGDSYFVLRQIYDFPRGKYQIEYSSNVSNANPSILNQFPRLDARWKAEDFETSFQVLIQSMSYFLA